MVLKLTLVKDLEIGIGIRVEPTGTGSLGTLSQIKSLGFDVIHTFNPDPFIPQTKWFG